MKDKTCCITGHRNIPDNIKSKLEEQLRITLTELISNGTIYFGVGGAIGFDMLAEQVIIELREQYPQIKLILVLPCHNHYTKWKQSDVNTLIDIMKRADKVVYVSDKYYKGVMLKRDRYLVDNSSYCIAYLTQDYGGTYYTVKYAQSRGLTINNIADMIMR